MRLKPIFQTLRLFLEFGLLFAVLSQHKDYNLLLLEHKTLKVELKQSVTSHKVTARKYADCEFALSDRSLENGANEHLADNVNCLEDEILLSDIPAPWDIILKCENQ